MSNETATRPLMSLFCVFIIISFFEIGNGISIEHANELLLSITFDDFNNEAGFFKIPGNGINDCSDFTCFCPGNEKNDDNDGGEKELKTMSICMFYPTGTITHIVYGKNMNVLQIESTSMTQNEFDFMVTCIIQSAFTQDVIDEITQACREKVENKEFESIRNLPQLSIGDKRLPLQDPFKSGCYDIYCQDKEPFLYCEFQNTMADPTSLGSGEGVVLHWIHDEGWALVTHNLSPKQISFFITCFKYQYATKLSLSVQNVTNQ